MPVCLWFGVVLPCFRMGFGMGLGMVVAPFFLDLSMVLAPVCPGFVMTSACFAWCWYGGCFDFSCRLYGVCAGVSLFWGGDPLL